MQLRKVNKRQCPDFLEQIYRHVGLQPLPGQCERSKYIRSKLRLKKLLNGRYRPPTIH